LAIRLSIQAQFTAEFLSALNWADRLFAWLKPEAFFQRPISLRHPCIFYYGHLPAFAWNQIFSGALARKPFNAEFDRLFARGIDPLDMSAPADSNASEWPPIEQVRAYKQQVESELFRLLATDFDYMQAGSLRSDGDELLMQAMNITLEHYLMHIETFIYMLHQLPRRAKNAPLVSVTPRKMPKNLPVSTTLLIPGGTVTLGRRRDSDGFGWCNEYSEIQEDVDDFYIDKYPVTNDQFLEFIEAGGYTNRSLWSDDGWLWIENTQRQHPQFWLFLNGIWYFRGLFGLESLPRQAPVWVSMSEAEAYANWKNANLLTESQYHRAAFGTETGEENLYPWGDSSPTFNNGNFGLQCFAPLPIGSHPHGASAFGVEELIGNGWEWTSSKFAPFPGFERLPTYPGYSSDFFDDHHYILKGASPVTSVRLIRRSYRNWFQPHYPYVYTKFRCVYRSKN
jgi:gamma-glutamyl hercynylcysteine S-oxide synthase